MSKILITGANSFVGNNFRKYSISGDTETISLLGFKPGDIDFSSFNVVLHLAAIVNKSGKIPEEEYMRVNRDLCLRVAEKAKSSGVRQFVFMSTLKVYGETGKKEIRNEDSVCRPDDAYGRSKLEAESRLRKLEDENFRVAIIRSPLIYGEGAKANMLKIIKLVNLFPILPFGKLGNMRNYTYIENLVGFIDRIIETKASGTFIIMDDTAISTTLLVKYISQSLDKKVYLFKLPKVILKACTYILPGIFLRLFGSNEFENKKTLLILNYKPPYTTEEGIRRMVKSYSALKLSGK
jgi:nucleoside-diphosphate-sugar epimerase